MQLNRGNSYSDVRRQWTGSVSYDLPFGKGKSMLNTGGIANAILGGWQLAALVSARSGIPFTVLTSGNITNAGGADRPNRIGTGNLSSGQSIDHWFDTALLSSSRNSPTATRGAIFCSDPTCGIWISRCTRVFNITENMRVQFRAESFNFTNTPAFGQPAATINSLGAGAITSANDPRRIQFGLKFIL